jgi:hypothetical protein
VFTLVNAYYQHQLLEVSLLTLLVPSLRLSHKDQKQLPVLLHGSISPRTLVDTTPHTQPHLAWEHFSTMEDVNFL